MTTDIGILRALARKTEARCYQAMKTAQDAQAAQHWPGNHMRDTGADEALERYLVALDEAERARRRLQAAEEAMTDHQESA
jgi:hypothetical protein